MGAVKALFTREERAVVLFLTLSLLVGSAVMVTRRVFPAVAADFPRGPTSAAADGPLEESGVPVPAGPVDVNSADARELVLLPGIGPVRAEAIVRLRDRRGGFESLDELLDVKGIGPATLERLRPEAALGPRVRPDVGGRPASSAPDTT